MLTIRLQRSGKKNNVFYHIILTQKTKAANKSALEVLAAYDPHTKKITVKSEDRIKYWVSQNVEMSASAHNLLVTHKLLDAPKVKAFSIKKKKEKK